MHIWLEPRPISIPKRLGDYIGGHPIVAETLCRRGITAVEDAQAFLDPECYMPSPATDFPDIVRTAERLELAIANQERILVWGDFDVDGQTSTTVLVTVLRDLGANVRFHIPVRGVESHGMKFPRFAEVLEEGTDIILTCDTGVSEHEAVAYANERGVVTLITDHHELPETLPDAYSIVNPHLLPEGHPLGALPGVGVAYKLAELLYERAGQPEQAEKLLDLVALGIVADVAEQTGDARYLLQRGLTVLRNTERLGLRELAGIAEFKLEAVHEETIGFSIGPRLNALGRLSDANDIVEFFTTEDRLRARVLAGRLEQLNERRKWLCQQTEDAANAHIASHPEVLNDAALVLAGSEWQAGVIGIVASRLVEKYQRPVVLFSSTGEVAHGSARSIKGCHITEAIATQADLLEAYGGHAAAAGMSLPVEHIDRFRRGLSAAVAEQLIDADTRTLLPIDGYLQLDELSVKLAEDFERLAPFGAGNPSLRFAVRGVGLESNRALGRDKRHKLLRVADDEGVSRDVYWWRWDGADLPEGKFDLAFTLRKNTYRGRTRAQIVLEDFRPYTPEEKPKTEKKRKSIEIIDLRKKTNDDIRTAIEQLDAEKDMFVYCEGNHRCLFECSTRLDAQPAKTLVLWTTPPSQAVLTDMLQVVKPERVCVVSRTKVNYNSFLEHARGAVAYVLKLCDGIVDYAALAAKFGYTETLMRYAFELFSATGSLVINVDEQDQMHIRIERSERDPELADEIQRKARETFDEYSAYVKHFQSVSAAKLREHFKLGKSRK